MQFSKGEKTFFAIYGGAILSVVLWGVAGLRGNIVGTEQAEQEAAEKNVNIVGVRLTPWQMDLLKKGDACTMKDVRKAFDKALKEKLDAPAVSPTVEQVYKDYCPG
jgi:hypothetical protein